LKLDDLKTLDLGGRAAAKSEGGKTRYVMLKQLLDMSGPAAVTCKLLVVSIYMHLYE
jgi:hypothetical protein